MQTTSVANSNPAAVPAWTDGSAAEATGAGRTGPVPSGAEEMSGEDLVRLIAKELKEGAGGMACSTPTARRRWIRQVVFHE